jgi:hypothetical protein
MTDEPNAEPNKKIIIDEDWKSRVQAEKEAIESRQEATQAEQQDATQAGQPEAPAGPLPPPTLEILVSSLGMQAMISMGLIPNPMTGKPEVELDQAKHLIDTIAMLEEKTEGNRTPEETAVLDNLLHELRMGYLAVQQNPSGS